MSRARRHAVTAAGAALAWALARSPALEAQSPEKLAEASNGVIEITDEKVVILAGLRGETILHAGNPGEIRFTSLRLDDQRTEVPLAVWVDGTELTLRAPEGKPDVPRTLDVAIPPGFDVKVDSAESAVRVGGLDANLTIKGPKLAVDARGINGNVNVDTSATKVHLESINGGASVRAKDAEIGITGVAGALAIHAARGTLVVSTARTIDGDLEEMNAKLDSVSDAIDLRTKAGQLVVLLAQRGGSLTLSGTALRLDRCDGNFGVETDAAVEIKNCKASIHVDGDGASVTGNGNTGDVDVRTRSAHVTLADVNGSTRVSGDALEAEMSRMSGSLTIASSNSQIKISDARGPLDIDADGGSVAIEKASKEIRLKSRDADVKIEKALGAIQLEADKARVEIGWSGIAFEGTSKIRNDGGPVTVHLPPQGSARIEVTAQYGRIENSLPKINVDPDQHKASGVIGYPGATLISIEAGGDVQLLAGESGGAPIAGEDNP